MARPLPLSALESAILNRPRVPARCEALAKRGTGTGTCDRSLDEHGRCNRASDHLEGA